MKENRSNNRQRVTDPGLAEPVRVAVVDDDQIYRAGLEHYLSQDLRVDVVESATHADAVLWASETWEGIDTLIVDIHDESALAIPGEDLYRGIEVLEIVKRLPLRTVAIVPSMENPLVNLRLVECGADELYLRSEIADVDTLLRAAIEAAPKRSPRLHSDDVLLSHGAQATSRPNRVVGYYRSSQLFGKLHMSKQIRLERRGASRRQMSKLSRNLEVNGFEPPSSDRTDQSRGIRWPEARVIVLKIIGRQQVQAEPQPDSEA